MSERQARGSLGRMSSPTLKSLRRLRVMSTGRWHAPLDARPAPTVIAVGAAEAGMGKSVVVCNLAASVAGLGRRVVVVDMDFRAPRQHALFGIKAPEESLEGWLELKRARRDELARPTSVRNVRLLPCAAAREAHPSRELRAALLRELHDLDSDVVIVDVGTQNRDDLFDFFATGAFRLLVTSRAPRALQATYAFLKGAASRADRLHGGDARAVLARFSGGLVGNATEEPEHEETLHAFSRLVREHLGMPVPVIGCLTTSERIGQSIVARQPLTVRRGIDDNVRQFHHMAETIMNDEEIAARACPLEGDPIDVAIAPLPAPIATYARKNVRYPVDWAGTLELPTGMTAVRVRDVSASGAAIETPIKLRVGDAGILRMDQLSGHPSVPVVVKRIVAAANRVGLGFTERRRVPPRLVAAARAALNRSSS
jgi:MinD-like ATPase involved in chromosome partitioning or flagellar assembly